MKKYFIKITAFSLLAFILPMIGGLCFQDLAHSIAKINIARAADNKTDKAITIFNLDHPAMAMDDLGMNNIDMAHVNINTDICNQEETSGADNYQNLEIDVSLPSPQNNNSVLPCCVGGTHPNLITSAQSLEIHKFISFAVYNPEKLPLNISQTISYQAPLTAPPELKTLQTTILRI